MTSPSPRRRLTGAGAALVALVAPVALALPAHASSTANEVVYSADDDNDGVYTVVIRDLESRRATTVLPELFQTDGGQRVEVLYDDPALSRDGSRIALSTDRGSAQFDEGIAVVSRDGSGFRRLTPPPSTSQSVFAIDVAPAWSPDGSTLLFTRITTDATDQADIKASTALFTVPAAGGTATAVPNASDGYTADWSPDGRRIVFAALPAAADVGPITVMGVDGSGRTSLGSAVGLMPAWSPDGATIAYATITERDGDRTRAEDTTQIATVGVDGGAPRVLGPTRPGSARTVAEYPTWTPDGESVVYDLFGYSSTDSFPPGDLWAVDRQGRRAGKVTVTPGDESQAHVQGPAPAPVSAGAASTYTPVPPKRILDTRNGTGAPAAKVGPGGTVDVAVAGVQTAQGAVPANASAVVLNLTATGITASTDVRAYPKGGSTGASNLNAPAGATVPNLVTVRLGTDGAISLRNSGGSVHLIGDIAGYYTPDTGSGAAGAGFAAVDPSRILDTRSPAVGASAAKVGPGGVVVLQATGTIPTAGGGTVTVPGDATAVVLNVTATGATASTDVRVYPAPVAGDASFPEVSNLNVRAGQTTPNLVTVAVGRDGRVRLRNGAGSVHLIADLAGYYSPSAGGRFVPVAPTRFLDTRSGIGGAPIPVTAAGFVDLRVAGSRGVPAGATAAVLNLTGTGVSASTDVRAFPATAAGLPEVSNLNLTRSSTRANLSIVKIGTDGRVRVRNGAGSVNLIGDLAGYMVG